MLNNIIIGMCGVNFTLFGCEEKILSKEHIVHCSDNSKLVSPIIDDRNIVVFIIFLNSSVGKYMI